MADFFTHADELLESADGQAAYDLLKAVYDSDETEKKNFELLWRLGRACLQIAQALPGDKDSSTRRNSLLREGQKYASDAVQLSDKDPNAALWLAHLSGVLIEHASPMEQIKMGLTFKEHMDNAILLVPDDPDLMYMRGRFHYGVASLSWVERIIATTIAGQTPNASFDDAISDFLEAERRNPLQSVENLLYLGKSYMQKGDKANALKYWTQAEFVNDMNDADLEALDEVRSLLAEHDNWGSVLVKSIGGLLNGDSYETLYNKVELELQIFQTAAILEIVHAVVGFVRSPVGTTVTQVFSRVTVVWLILYKVPSSRSSIGVPMLLVAWSITEVVRYSFYALNLINAVPHLLIWMRYTFFIVLYPLGASGEVITMIAALPEIHSKKHFTVELPNAANFGFSFYYFVIILCLIYLPGFPHMYGHMFTQRRKVLGADAKKKE